MGSVTPIVFTFAGQGSQAYHMGRSLYQSDTGFRDCLLRLDQIVYEQAGYSVIERLYDPRFQRSDAFDDIRFTHPAIFMVEYALTQVLRERGIIPDIVLGASLGECCAAVLSGMLSLDDALATIVTQAQILHHKCPRGSMLAILAPTSVYEDLGSLREDTEIAAFNYEGSFVIAGHELAVRRIQDHLSRSGTLTLPLPVRQAFHCALLEVAEHELRREVRQPLSKTAAIQFVSCTRGGPLGEPGPAYLWEMIRRPIQVARAVQYLEGQGNHLYLDLSPSGTFVNFIKYNPARRPASVALPLLSPFGQDIQALSAALTAVAKLPQAAAFRHHLA